MRALLIAGLALGCSVDRSGIDEDVFGCLNDGDCVDGYQCQIVDTAGNGWCAPLAGDECAGTVTAAGACVAECEIGDESACEPGLECVRGSVLGSGGYCQGASPCSADADCPEGQACISTLLDRLLDAFFGPAGIEFATDELTCVAVGCKQDPDVCGSNGECLFDLVSLEFADAVGGADVCVPRCGDDGACPASLACSSIGSSFGVCLPGLWELGCQDDLNCLLGTCQDASEGSICATCARNDGTPACSPDREAPDGTLNQLRCVDRGGAEVCAFQQTYGGLCSETVPCAEGLECTRVSIPDPEGGRVELDICVRPCTYCPKQQDADCNDDCTTDAFCISLPDPPISLCLVDLVAGEVCAEDDNCVSHDCDLGQDCGGSAGTGCCR